MNTTITANIKPGAINGHCDTCDAFGQIIPAGDDLLCETHTEKWLAKESALALFRNDMTRDAELQNDPRFRSIWARWNDKAAVTGTFTQIGRELEDLYNSADSITFNQERFDR